MVDMLIQKSMELKMILTDLNSCQKSPKESLIIPANLDGISAASIISKNSKESQRIAHQSANLSQGTSKNRPLSFSLSLRISKRIAKESQKKSEKSDLYRLRNVTRSSVF